MESNGNTPGNSTGTTEAQDQHNNFWPKQMELIRNLKHTDFKQQELPLARIKKIMKLDDDVKMISAEAPVLFSKAAEIFIAELSLRAWLHTEENKRRTLQRNDIAMAITKYDQFDFLIDIVPRDELKPPKRQEGQVQQATMMPDQVQYYFQLAQNQQQQQQVQQQQQQQQQPTTHQATTSTAGSTGQMAAAQPGQIQLVTTPGGQQQFIIAAPTQTTSAGQTPQVQTVTVSNNENQVQLLTNQGNQGTAVPVQLQTAQGTNIQQLVSNTGEVQQVQFSPQIQFVRPAQGQQQGNTTELGQTVYQIQQVPMTTQSGQVTQQVFLQQAAGGDATSGTTPVQLTEQSQ